MREWAEAGRVRTFSSQQTPRYPQDPYVEAELTSNPQESQNQPYTPPECPIPQGNFPSPLHTIN